MELDGSISIQSTSEISIPLQSDYINGWFEVHMVEMGGISPLLLELGFDLSTPRVCPSVWFALPPRLFIGAACAMCSFVIVPCAWKPTLFVISDAFCSLTARHSYKPSYPSKLLQMSYGFLHNWKWIHHPLLFAHCLIFLQQHKRRLKTTNLFLRYIYINSMLHKNASQQ